MEMWSNCSSLQCCFSATLRAGNWALGGSGRHDHLAFSPLSVPVNCQLFLLCWEFCSELFPAGGATCWASSPWFSGCCQAPAWTDWEETVSWAQGVMLLGSQSAELKKKSSGAMITLWRTSRRGDFWLSSSMVHMANARAQVVWLSQHSKPQRSCILCDPRSVSLAPKPNYTRPSTAVQIT